MNYDTPAKEGIVDNNKPEEVAFRELQIALAQKDFRNIERIIGVPVAQFSDFNSYLEAATKKLWCAWRAVELVSDVITETPFSTKSSVDGQLMEDRDLNLLLTKPNDFDSWYELVYVTVAYIKWLGEAFWVKDQMDLRGRPKALFALNPKFVEKIPDPVERIRRYDYKVNGRIISFAPEEVIYFRKPNPNDSLGGLGVFRSGEPLFKQALNRDTYQEKFMEQGAAPSGVLVNEQDNRSDKEKALAKQEWNKEYRGVKNFGKIAWLFGKWQFLKLGLSSAEMQDLETAKWTTEEIFLHHGVPLSVAGIKDAANYATAKIDSIAFRKNTCLPLVKLMLLKLNNELITAFNPNLVLTAEMKGLLDVEQIVKDYLPLVESGVITRNEMRELAGLQRDETSEFHDTYTVNANVVPVDLLGMAPQIEE